VLLLLLLLHDVHYLCLCQVYAIDLLGLGNSWPTNTACQQSGPLRYSADTWTEQLHHFITDKIGEPVYIAGNSLGEEGQQQTKPGH